MFLVLERYPIPHLEALLYGVEILRDTVSLFLPVSSLSHAM